MPHTFFDQKTVLVTGGAGFIGSHLCEQLLHYGAHVIAVDNLLTGSQDNIVTFEHHPAFTFITTDAAQPPASYLPPSQHIDVILHFASPASPPRYQAYPIETYLINTMGTHHLLQYLKNTHPHARMIFASTSEVYGDPQIHPQVESYWGNVNPNGIRSCYDEAKRLGETICGVHAREFGLDVRIVRIFNTYGPRMDATDGRIIPQFINQALKGENLTVYGDGSQTRSFCYVSDLVDVILRYAAADNLAGETINIGNPDEYTVKETAEKIVTLVGNPSAATIEYHPLPQDDPTRRKPDITHVKELLGWHPQVSFEEGMRQTIKYFAHL